MASKSKSRRSRKALPLILSSLLLINAGVAHLLIDQIAGNASAEAQVKGSESVLPEEDQIDVAPPSADEGHEKSAITIYKVKSGDTISGIASKFGITTGTIYAANDLQKNQVLKVGTELVILPITGIKYTVKSGDTISGIAKKFDVPAADILDYNDIDNPGLIKEKLELIIPNAEPIPPAAPKAAAKPAASAKNSGTSAATPKTSSSSTASTKGMFINPVPGSVLTQALHAINAVDLGAPTGTAVVAAAAGTVIVAKGNGDYNGGFGNFVVITHGDGIQTLYAHMSKVTVSVGDKVDQGEQIGLVGSTGKSTGPHTHFEVHGTTQPFARDKKGTHY